MKIIFYLIGLFKYKEERGQVYTIDKVGDGETIRGDKGEWQDR
jgi:hypothetical protein